VVVPANVPHGFKGASSDGPVRMVGIHPVAEMDTTFLDEPALPPG
jgi:quercetin dioxygenase-like cupin family protein